ncbi:MAG: hypothetical protein JW850_15090 [Thermoflexales bacterium]|nr:hypothetical protein [Thermoflexales bacterium]
MNTNRPTFLGLTIKAIVVHTLSYFLMGILAFNFLNYAEGFASAQMACWMRQTNDPIVMAGVLFQPLRGLVFALAFYPLRESLFGRKNGWLVTWWILVALGILSTFGPTPGSIEGMIYTVIPIPGQLTGWLEVVPQALLLSVGLYYWVNHPEKKWLNWVLGVAFVLVLFFPILGLLVTNPT